MVKQRAHAVLGLLFAFLLTLVALGNGCGSDGDDDGVGGNGAADGGDGSSGSSGASGNGSSGFGTSSGATSSGTSGTSSGTTSSGSVNNCVAPQAVVLSPATKAQSVTPGTPFTQAYTAMADGKDVTAQTQFTTNDSNVGTFTGATFTWGNKFGGSLLVKGMYCGVIGTAALDLKVLAPPFTAGPGATTLPTDFTNAPASTNTACKPILKYPPDQILLPPNTNVVEVHFMGAGNNKFEISFTNDATDVRIYTTCTAPLVGGLPDVANGAAAPGVPGGCLFELNQAEWDVIANSNREGNPLTVGVRGLGCDGGNAAASDTRKISFAKQDIVGTIYYWASIRVDSGATNTGGVYRYDYGKRAQVAEAVLSPAADTNGRGNKYLKQGSGTQLTNTLCIGCHVVDREGRKMIFDFDDNDSDDEYGDMWTSVFDIPSRTSTSEIKKGAVNSFSAGFSSWNRQASRFLKSDGWGNGLAGEVSSSSDGPRGTFHVVSNVGAPVGKTDAALIKLRGSTPDIAPNDNQVVFAASFDDGLPEATHVPGGPTTPGYFGASSHPNVAPDDLTDEYFSGAGLYIAAWDTAANKISNPTAIFPAAASTATSPPNYYYPAFSPDGSMIVFNYAASGANFHNPKARVQLVTSAGGVAADQHKANETNPVENGGDITNSWVRWTPFIQEYKGKKLAWVTFSSTRSYGLRLDNTATVDCHPKENPDTTVYPVFTDVKNKCARAQLWMAAIDLDTGKVATGADVSYPAFWLPFQDINTQNHLGQWTQKNLDGTCSGDAGTCPTGRVCDNGACASVPPPSTNPPPQAECSQDVQCATGKCCTNNVCGACTGTTAPPPCNTCLDCNGGACNGAEGCGGCKSSADCCAPLICSNGECIDSVK